MALPFICVLLALFLSHESVTADSLGDILAPVLAPIMDDVCKGIECGKGTCKPSSSNTFFFQCECDSGWKQTTSNSSDHFKFLPCVIPDCSMDYSCAKAPAPVSDKSNKANTSIFDPCYWMDCGGGTCNKTSKMGYNCECGEGYYNLLNVTTLPCFQESSIGMDCAHLGITVSNKSTSPPTPALANNSNYDDVCKGIECGKGTCKPSSSSTFFFQCECDSGWKQTTSNSSDHFKFLPCVIPDCSMDYSCAKAPAPVSDKSNKANTSIFDPCYWMDCGGGTCNKTSKMGYNCECGEGYYNLLNVTTLPCFQECSIGMDCSHLGITVSNTSTSPPTPALADNSNYGCSTTHGKSITLVILMMSIVMVHGI